MSEEVDLTIVDQERMSLLGLMLGGVLTRNLSRPDGRAVARGLSGALGVTAGKMSVTLRFDRGPVTRHEYVREILRLAGSPCRVQVAPPGYFKRVAPVSPNESAVNHRLASLGIETMENWRDSLARYLRSLNLA